METFSIRSTDKNIALPQNILNAIGVHKESRACITRKGRDSITITFQNLALKHPEKVHFAEDYLRVTTPRQCRFLVCGHTCVAVIPQGNGSYDKVGVAHMAPGDIWNESIGKALALMRAIGAPSKIKNQLIR